MDLRRSHRLERRMIRGLSSDRQPPSQLAAYVGRTIRSTYRNRLSILPIFPTTLHDQQPHLLLPNVPSEFDCISPSHLYLHCFISPLTSNKSFE